MRAACVCMALFACGGAHGAAAWACVRLACACVGWFACSRIQRLNFTHSPLSRQKIPSHAPPQIANMPVMGGLNGLSVAAPLLCPADEQNPDQPTTAAAAAAAVAAAGVLQGALIGLGGAAPGAAAHPSHLQALQMNTTAPAGEP
jgi:hypothetical protein